MADRLTQLTIQGYKTIRELKDFIPRPINVLIGANGAGKSNFISFFRLISWMIVSPGNLQLHVSSLGGANALLHDGAAQTPQIEASLTVETDQGKNDYFFRLFHAAGDTLIFAEEKYRFTRSNAVKSGAWQSLGGGHREAKIIEKAEEGEIPAKIIVNLLRRTKVFQFHNTSATARMRGKWDIDDNRWLKEDAANIAPVLLRLRDNEPKYYRRIVDTVRTAIPFFADFELDADYGKVLLRWREQGSDVLFNASQASDGMLRAIALMTLLCQPEEDLPEM
jgi:predicted ATPase